ncbi:MAG: L,D-transpeptidase [Candidatus Ventricola sp.]
MMKSLRRLAALLLCLLLTCVSTGAMAATKLSKTFTQKPTLNVRLSSTKAYSGEYASFTVTPNVPGFLTVQLLTPDGSVVLVLEDQTEIHTKANSFDYCAKDNAGVPLPDGEYQLAFSMVSQYGVESAVVTKKLTVRTHTVYDDDGNPIPVATTAPGSMAVLSVSAGTTGSTVSAMATAAPLGTPVPNSNTMTYAAGTFSMGEEGLLIGVGVTDTADQQDAGFWGLTADATDEQIWAALTRKLTGVDVGETESAYIYDSVSESRKRLGTISGISQGVNVVAERTDGWSLVEAYRNEDGAFVRGYIRTNKLRTSEPNTTYGLVIDKATQMLYVYKEGVRVGSCRVSTGLPTPKYPHRETPAGEFITVTRRGTTEYYGNGYCKYSIRLNGSYLLCEIPSTKKNGTNFSILETLLGQKATRGNIAIAHDASADGGINAEWIWNMTDANKRVKVLIFDDKPRTEVPVSSTK